MLVATHEAYLSGNEVLLSRRVRAYAPASIGNFAAGFDVLGAALAPLDGSLWGDVVSAELAAEPSLVVSGPYANRLPSERGKNLVWMSLILLSEVLARKNLKVPPLLLRLEKNLPVGSGLGSSASSVVATLTAVNALLFNPLDSGELLRLAGLAEAKTSGAVILDNVAPALLGGLRLVTPAGQAPELPWPAELLLVMVCPELEVETAAARACLPGAIELAMVVEYGRNLASFIHALHDGDRVLLAASLRDPLVEPHRAFLVPGFRQAQRAALGAGALGCSFSGAGPAIFAVAPRSSAEAVGEGVRAVLAAEGVGSSLRLCTLDPVGARLLPEVSSP